MMQAQISKTIVVTTAGSLNSVLAASEKSTVTNLTVTGSINALDFITIRDSMPAIIELDLSGSTIVAYTGVIGTNSSRTYMANSIPPFAFYDSKNYFRPITTIVIPSSTVTIGSNAFNGLRKLNAFTITSSVATIGMDAFSNCANLTLITIPASVTSIGHSALSASGLQEITVDAVNSKYSSENGVLFNKNKTELIQCPLSKTGDYTIPNSVSSIASVAFLGNSLSNIEIPNSLTTIGSQAFNWGNGNLNVDANNTNFISVDGVLYNVDKTCILECPKNKTGNFDIPSSVINIGQGAFSGCLYLESIKIPSTVTTIQSLAFSNCSGLQSIYSNSINPIVLNSSNDYFNYVDKTACTLYVPIGSKALYASAYGWKDFTNSIETTSLSATDISTINDETVSFYPNPSKLGFTIKNADNSLLQIYSLNGELIFNATVSNNENISTQTFQPGMYILKIICKDQITSRSLIVE